MATAAKVAYAHIVKEPDYCGGKAAIDNTRVRVADVVHLHEQGASPAQILVQYPDLSLGQVHAALTYYYDHPEEIEATLALEETAEADYERAKAEYLSRQLTFLPVRHQPGLHAHTEPVPRRVCPEDWDTSRPPVPL